MSREVDGAIRFAGEVIAELGRDRITMDETFKAATWLQHHDYPRDDRHAIATRDMPILVKAHILFKRKRDEEEDKLWEEIAAKIKTKKTLKRSILAKSSMMKTNGGKNNEQTTNRKLN